MTKDEVLKLALEALQDMNCGWRYIRESHGDLYGVGWDRSQEKADDAIKALRQALEQPDPFDRLIRIMGTFDLSTGHADHWTDLLDSLESELRDVLGYYREMFKAEPKCSLHPDAPHGFNRDASHNYGRYVCDCEGWEPPDDDAAWAKHLKEPMSEKRVHESDTMERHVSYVCPQCHWTLEQPGQEPVAWLDVDEYEAYSNSELDEEAKKDLTPLYAAPPKREFVCSTGLCHFDGEWKSNREWQGLTDEEIFDVIRSLCVDNETAEMLIHVSMDEYRAIEAKLKEKNT